MLPESIIPWVHIRLRVYVKQLSKRVQTRLCHSQTVAKAAFLSAANAGSKHNRARAVAEQLSFASAGAWRGRAAELTLQADSVATGKLSRWHGGFQMML